MCFTNLPVEFDENGDPYLADEAEDVEHPDGCGCEAALDELDPEAAYEGILAEMPDRAREHLDRGTEPASDPDAPPGRAGGD